MTGSIKYLIVPTTKYKRSLKTLRKLYKSKREQQVLKQFVSEQLLKKLRSNPDLPQSRPEPLPSNINLPENITFRKLEFNMEPRRGGASGCGRLMYLVDSEQNRIVLLWIYTHEEFPGRPDDKSLRNTIQDAINSLDEN